MRAKYIKLSLIAGALLLFVLLFIAPKTKPALSENSKSAANQEVVSNGTIDIYLKTAEKNIPEDQQGIYTAFKSQGKNDSLIAYWDKRKRPDLAAFFAERSASTLNKSAENWLKAGNRYYYAVQFTGDKTETPLLYQSAMRCFKKATELDPKNADARIMLAACYVEGSSDPMKGISLLREVEKMDSNNVKMHLNFAFFSVKSGQLDKAIERFNKVLQIDSNYIEAYLHLADAYEQKQEKDKTITMLQLYASRTQDMTARTEIAKYIQQLKNNN